MPQQTVSPKDTLVYVGTYTGPKSKGIYHFRLQTSGMEVSQNITLVPLGLAAESPSPSFLELDLKRRLLFAVNELTTYEGKPAGAVSAFSIDATGKLTLINQKSSMGPGPCHLVLDKTGKFLIVSNYDGGSVAVIPVAADGKLGDATEFIQHKGKSIKPQQEAAHAHCATFDPSYNYVYICDLGLDQVLAYKLDTEKGKLTPANPAVTAIKPGSGPRHMVFRPDGKFAYVINELSSTINTFSFDPATGALKQVQEISTLPGYYDGPNDCAEIGMHPSGKWVYGSNRGHNSVVLYDIDKDTGLLKWVEEQGAGGKTPRHFGIQPSAVHMAICNQDSDTVLAARIDSGNGRLKPSGVFASCPAPVCAIFLPPK